MVSSPAFLVAHALRPAPLISEHVCCTAAFKDISNAATNTPEKASKVKPTKERQLAHEERGAAAWSMSST
eukprot:5511619-Prymnesium_polylepis.1